MERDRIWTADELDQMTPHERERLMQTSVLHDLASLPPEFAARVRARGRALAAELRRQGPEQ